MKLDWRFVSREFKEKFKEIQALGPGTRMHFCLAPRGEFNGKSLADVYGINKLERQEWRIPESEYMTLQPRGNTERSGDPVIGGSGDRKIESLTAENAESAEGIGPSEHQDQAHTALSGKVEPISGIPIEHLAMFKPAEAMELIDRARRESSTASAAGEKPNSPTDEKPQKSQWELGYEWGKKEERERARYEIEKELRARLGLPDAWQQEPKMIDWHRQQLKKLEKADAAPRCEWIFSEGTRCCAPKMKGGRLCYAHERMEQAQRKYKNLKLLVMEDASSIIMNLSEIGQAVVNEEITDAKARILLAKHRMGLQALKLRTFDQTDVESMVTRVPGRSGDRKANTHHGDTERREPQRAQRSTEEKQVSTADEHGLGRMKEHSAVSDQHSAHETVSRNGRAAEEHNLSGVRGIDGSRPAPAEQVPHARQNKSIQEVSGDQGSVRDGDIAIAGYRDTGVSEIQEQTQRAQEPTREQMTLAATGDDPGDEFAKPFRFGVDGVGTPEIFYQGNESYKAG